MNKLQIKVVSGSFLVLATLFGYMFWSQATSSNVQQKQMAGDFTNATNQSKTLTENIVDDEKPVEEIFPLEMKEYQIQNAIHFMSHQKVVADEKWGAIQITPERINRLTEIIEQNQADYQHSQLYLDILSRWSEGDFSRADHDHNAIWKLQNGNVGEATGVLSTADEQKFIEKHFK